MMAFNRDGWSSGGRRNSSGTSMVLVTGDGNMEGDQRRWGATVFRGEEEEARQLHGGEDGCHNEEWRYGQGGRRQQLVSRGRR
jgi:hypothetical protein